MLAKHVVAALPLLTTALASPTSKRGVEFNWGSEKVRGVNIGGWLVLEPWITPSFFDGVNKNRTSRDIVDEYILGQKLGNDVALELLRTHWNSWATWGDFEKIKQAGINIVRIPIGFWAYDTFGAPYTQGSAVYMDAAIDWCRSLGLKVIIDLHGAPGSQNGFDNSGQKTKHPTWTTGDTVENTLKVLKTISQKYAQKQYQDVVAAIELLNEPALFDPNISTAAATQFYRDGYGQIREISDTPVMFHDGFKNPSTWNGILSASDANAYNVALDHHEYQVFNTGFAEMSAKDHINYVCSNSESYTGADKWTVIGEWSGAMTDCARYLNGYDVGARYDGTVKGSTKFGDCSFQNDLNKWSQSFKDDTRRYIEAQIYAFEQKTQGWIWWNFKTENAHEWDLLKLVDGGIFPAISYGSVQYKFGPYCQ